jgi:acyl-CoA thioesterase-1
MHTLWSTRAARRWLSTLCIVITAFTAPVRAAEDSRPVILAIGESTTAGYGVPAGLSYPAQLQALLDAAGYHYRVVNHGRNGSTTEMALANLTRGMLLQPEIVLIAIGGNDAEHVQAVRRTEANLRKLVSLFAETDAAVFLAARGADTDGGSGERNALYARIADEEGAMLMPSLRQDLAGHPELLLSDMRHPNADGYAIVAQRIFELLQPRLER